MYFLQVMIDELGRRVSRMWAAARAYIVWFERTNRGKMRQVMAQHLLTLLLGVLVGYGCSRLSG